MSGGGNHGGTVGANLGTLLSTTVEDVHGNAVLVAGTTLTLTAAGSGASGIFANGPHATMSTTDSNGAATTTERTVPGSRNWCATRTSSS